MIELRNIHLQYKKLKILKDINLKINKGEMISITGQSGAGKTSLLNIIGTLEKPSKGIVKINENEIQKLNDNKISLLRNNEIGFVFQFHNLLNEFTALENIILPALIMGESKKIAEIRAKEILDSLDLSNRDNHKPNQLSGGEQQRVAIARSIINSPSILLADEPTGNLDEENSSKINNILSKLNQDFNQTMVIVSHKKGITKFTNRNLELTNGTIIEE
ncbi:MAG: lipoprotein-releasing system ATP-binding protein LolD [Flavobacteriales bacterium]|nr:lipoprotein-releasing system ATP-binding protein LolD [Flavobacteriales bacterium]|tara:strand:- start:2382 stop:3038 length:657 start_codon:yes stop_codon:yes gene_type:complete